MDKLLDGAKPRLMVTDPPYGVNYDPSALGETGGAHRRVSGSQTITSRSLTDRLDTEMLFAATVG